MNVIVDLFFLDPHYKQDEDEVIFYGKMTKFIKQRLKVLREEIDEEEKMFSSKDENMIAVTIVYFISPKGGLKFLNYSPKLTSKMNDSFSQEDFNYLGAELQKFFSSRNGNGNK